MRESTYSTLEALVELCKGENALFLLLAGDIYEGPGRNLRAQDRLRSAMEDLEAAGVQVFVVHGNHDPLRSRFLTLDWPSNVHFFGPEKVERIPVELDGEVVANVYGISYEKADTASNLAGLFSPDESTGGVHIGLLHCMVAGCSDEHASYAPCSMQDLVDSRMDYWALGHVHRHQILRESGPMVVYAGNTQGRHINENGERGCFLVDVDQYGEFRPRFVPLDSYRWEKVDVGISGVTDPRDLLDLMRDACHSSHSPGDPRSHIVRVVASGRGPLHEMFSSLEDFAEFREGLEASLNPGVTLESVKDRTRPDVDLDALKAQDNLLGQFLRLVDNTIDDEEALLEISSALEPLYGKPTASQLMSSPDIEGLNSLVESAGVKGLDLMYKE